MFLEVCLDDVEEVVGEGDEDGWDGGVEGFREVFEGSVFISLRTSWI